MKKLYLTFDIETIVSNLGKNPNYYVGVYLGALYIADELKKRNLKATFFMSLSSKQDEIENKLYAETVINLIHILKNYENIKLAPHIHAYKLPVGFNCKSDRFGDYDANEQKVLLEYSKDFFSKCGLSADCFRPGGFSSNSEYYKILNEVGFRYSSIMRMNEPPTFDLVLNHINKNDIRVTAEGIREYPVTSVKVKSIKGKEALLNLSPDFFRIDSVAKYIQSVNYVCVNFHSFSVFLNRPIRENHKNIILKNIRFVCFEKILNVLLHKIGIETLNMNTPMRREFIAWLDFFVENKYETFFIGE